MGAKEKGELSSKDFTKKFIKHFIINGIVAGFLIGVIYAVAEAILPSFLVAILSLALVYFGIVKVYLSAIQQVFVEGKIHREDIPQILTNITIIFVIMCVVDIVMDIIPYINSLDAARLLGVEDVATRTLIIRSIVSIVMYTIITKYSKKQFIKECHNEDNVI